MKPTFAAFCLFGATLTAGCATQPHPAAEITGLEPFSGRCPTEPPVLTDAEIDALIAQHPNADDRERTFWVPRDLQHRACEIWERQRADALLALNGRRNQAVRNP